MINIDEQIEREARAARLLEARRRAGKGGARILSQTYGWNENRYKAHEIGRNGFGLADAKKYAKTFGVSLNWLYFGTGSPEDAEPEMLAPIDVPLISWVSAGMLGEQQQVTDASEFPTITALDLPEGDWIALRVQGNSMNKISPPESIIFVNRRDKRLVANACYVIADESGAATYKRYRPGDAPPFQPASYELVDAPKLEGAVSVIGRVRRSVIEM